MNKKGKTILAMALTGLLVLGGLFVYREFFWEPEQVSLALEQGMVDTETLSRIQEGLGARSGMPASARNPLAGLISGDAANNDMLRNLQDLHLVFDAQRGDSGDFIDLVGTLEGETRDVVSRVSGTVSSVLAVSGETVESGQPLLIIDDTEYRISYMQALIDYENSMGQPEKLREIKEMQLEVAERNLNNTIIVAPASGTIFNLSIREGDEIGRGAVIAQIVNRENMRVTAAVDETSLRKLQQGMKAEVTFGNLDLKLTGKLSYISPVAQISGGIVLIPIKVTLDYDPAMKNLVPGTTCDLRLIVMELRDSIVIPRQGLYYDRETGDPYVLRKTQTGQETVLVRLGEMTDTRVQIIDGLKDGDTIIIVPDQQELERLTRGTDWAQAGFRMR